ncbi:MAG: hypothetical protein IPL61_24235 [Myxococcales bacterium]|nr:hypothetical protein [Myxococcales bacterium]
MSARRAAAILALALVAGCTDLSQRWELDHARVLAVRLSAPGLAPGEVATVDALVVDDAGVPAVVRPTGVTVVTDLGLAVTAAADADGWTVTAGDADAIATARAAGGLAPDAPLIAALGVLVTVDGQQLLATKQVRLGEPLANPPTPTILVDGAALAPASLAIGRAHALTLDGVVPADDLAFDWLTSTGTLTYSETSAATLELAADDPASGHVVALVRSDVGGAAWATTAVVAGP